MRKILTESLAPSHGFKLKDARCYRTERLNFSFLLDADFTKYIFPFQDGMSDTFIDATEIIFWEPLKRDFEDSLGLDVIKRAAHFVRDYKMYCYKYSTLGFQYLKLDNISEVLKGLEDCLKIGVDFRINKRSKLFMPFMIEFSKIIQALADDPFSALDIFGAELDPSRYFHLLDFIDKTMDSRVIHECIEVAKTGSLQEIRSYLEARTCFIANLDDGDE